jgi:hypothetical protein
MKRLKVNYRKIYEDYHGIKIGKDEFGRSHEIHHIDGDHSNNDPLNLKEVTILEHYHIHLQHGDYGACSSIASRMKLQPSVISELATKHNLKMIADGTHPFLGGEVQLRKLQNGTHHFQGEHGSKLATERHRKQLAEGRHRSQVPGYSQWVSELNKKMLRDGTHPSQIRKTCEHCGKVISIGMFTRWHGIKCKSLNQSSTL